MFSYKQVHLFIQTFIHPYILFQNVDKDRQTALSTCNNEYVKALI